MLLNAVIKCRDKDELDVTLKLQLANAYISDKIIKVLYCIVFLLAKKLLFTLFLLPAYTKLLIYFLQTEQKLIFIKYILLRQRKYR